MSDRMLLLTMLKQTKFTDKTNLEFKSRNLNDTKIGVIKEKLFAVDWIWELNNRSSSVNDECRDKLYKAQKVCIQTVAKLKPRDSLNGVFQALQTIPFPDLIKLELTKLGFKVSKKYLPAPILTIFNASGGEKKHKYQTRNKTIPNIQKHQSILFSNSFLCGSIR